MKQGFEIQIENHTVRITHPEKVFWPEEGTTKLEYIKYLIDLSPMLLKYTKNKGLTTIRYPHGVTEDAESFFQKNVPDYAPDWVNTYIWRETKYILLNDLATLVWLGNQGCLEFHLPFHPYDSHPIEIAYDLDPMDPTDFSQVLEVALYLKEVLDSLGLPSYPKTSGASGLQIYIPIPPVYSYEVLRDFNAFLAKYLVHRYPQQITIERLIQKRGKKVYFDYLQYGEGKTLPAPYSVRATKTGTVSAPVTWEEVESGFLPTDFTLKNMKQRVMDQGDLFQGMSHPVEKEVLDQILRFVRKS